MIRDFAPGYLGAVVELFQRSVREVASRDYSPAELCAWAPEPPDWEAWSRRLETDGVFVCERDGGLVGFIRIDDAGCIDLLYVHPAAQRQGVAQELLDRAVSWATQRRIRRLQSEVSITARPFFERNGFHVVTEQMVKRRGVSLQNFQMERKIGAASA